MRWEDTDLTPEEIQKIHDRNTATPDSLDGYWGALADMDSKKLNRSADDLRNNGVTDSFLALCIRLIWGPLGVLLLGGAIATYLVLNGGVS